MDPRLVQIPYDKFMSSFLPPKDGINEACAVHQIIDHLTIDRTLSNPKEKTEDTQYPGLTKLIQASLATNKLLARDLSRWSKDEGWEVTSDIVIYKGIYGRPAHENDLEDSSPSRSVDTHGTTDSEPEVEVNTDIDDDADLIFKSNMNYYHAEMFIEDKTGVDNVALRIDGNDVISPGFEPQWAHEQIGEYVAEILRCQHRTHMFSVLTVGTTARFLRWDRSGVIASTPISFVDDTASFVTFFYRYGQMADWERGYDQSVSPALQEDEEALQDFKNEILPTLLESHKAMFEEAFFDTDERGLPLCTVVLEKLHPAPDSTSAPPRESPSQRSDSFHQPALHESSFTSNPDDNKIRLLIRHPITSPCSIFGRATKGFVALDLGEKKLKFLKDSWSYHGGNYHPEIEVYGKLQQAGVKNIAKVEGGGDVLGVDGKPQTTFAHSYLKVKSDDDEEYLPQQHYRLLIRQLGTPLEKYDTSYSLCYYILLALIAHCMAWERRPNNIMIDEEAEDDDDLAFLIDWDLCRYKKDLGNGRAQKLRSGTWTFTSAALLKYPTKQHDLADDLESFVHVLHWFCLRFHSHDMSGDPGSLAEVLSNIYFYARREEGYDLGGTEKFKLMRSGGVCFNLTQKKVTPGLIRLVNRLSKMCQKRYQTLDIESLEATSSKVLKRKEEDTASTQTTVKGPKRRARNPTARLRPVAEDKADIRVHSSQVGEPVGFHAKETTTDESVGNVDGRIGNASTQNPPAGKQPSLVDDKDDFKVPYNPFATHDSIIDAFQTLFTEEASSLWDAPDDGNDKRNDQFNVVVLTSLSVAPIPFEKNTQTKIQHCRNWSRIFLCLEKSSWFRYQTYYPRCFRFEANFRWGKSD
ncbi:hypothetical protein C8Q75DRAFT_731103 [Abortiporus biennis]|nr:hypothetical protein C8Q75DRAFT_731103 [Abortiporus biennis]